MDQATYRRRLAIWLTHHARLFAAPVADLLGLARPSVWKRIGEYNRYGPAGLERRGRGGRRWAFLSWGEENALLAAWHTRALQGEVMTGKHMLEEVCAHAGREVSFAYV